ncbi:2-keto-4-pentenoate hydratase/2-oxohepta-3-ene-1,7-dioic acid hydratase (catechol pathway) [Halorientalis persicus]|jgi:2-keto-4-pentenoate hydratase/2-oxohepta-3-ene-1,7-dioic acid hydratase in catechol pathway|uniref:2-keto-4-pentenoate hydratase/2-oxohepta-3-ene-1,7-dioic acid hydratase (Catechol pathway) n=1 Tax=Halorientalis persicus TaxID=1367881 RepID=A0A1H8RH14_9EURY|nr:fumarylacetoacetate hydrolase family protein [Halorientalis persicus]SEO65656.1 2-keto-4-pentenoate hydratase/2-oxohepta-3-ene-1,7-dioic acid hydratase (catechol pathway) [Halorientalis persicus]
MRLASFAVETPVGPARRVGVEHEGELLDVNAGYAYVLAMDGEAAPVDLAETIAPASMIDFLRRGQRAFDAAEEVLEWVPDADAETGPGGARLRYDPTEVDLLAPVPRPNSLRDYMAFEEHVANTLGDIPDVWYDRPVCYKGNADQVVGDGDVVEWPPYSTLWDIELEIGAVIGQRGTGIDADEAEEYVAGYTLFNDFSARDEQGEEMDAQLGPARGKDFANAFGPYLVTPDELDLPNADFSVEVTGEDGETEVWSEGTVGEMEHSWGEIIEHTAEAETLYPGDVLGSGTVGTGCGLEIGEFLDDGDTVSISIEGLGTLTNTVVES